MSAIQTVAGGCLPDRQYRYLDRKRNKRVRPPGVKSFSQVKDHLPSSSGVRDQYVIPIHTPISNQGRAGSCVANATCDACEIVLGVQHGAHNVIQLSRRGHYWVSRYTHGSTDWDGGTYLRAAAWQAQEVGFVREEYFPYSDKFNDLIVSPPLEYYTMAGENRVTGHFRFTTVGQAYLDDVDRSVRANHPVAFGTVVNKDFQRYRGGGHVIHRPTVYNRKSRHAMIVVGVRWVGNIRQYLWRNSWSRRWGDDGYCWVDEAYMGWGETKDSWMYTRMNLVD